MAFVPMARQDTTQSVKCQTPKGQILVQSPPPRTLQKSQAQLEPVTVAPVPSCGCW